MRENLKKERKFKKERKIKKERKFKKDRKLKKEIISIENRIAGKSQRRGIEGVRRGAGW